MQLNAWTDGRDSVECVRPPLAACRALDDLSARACFPAFRWSSERHSHELASDGLLLSLLDTPTARRTAAAVFSINLPDDYPARLRKLWRFGAVIVASERPSTLPRGTPIVPPGVLACFSCRTFPY